MVGYAFFHPIEVRYGDLDPQGHVNNAKYLTYLEQARVAYMKTLGLWDGKSFLEVGFILADAHLTFRAPIYLGQQIRVGVRTSHFGNKSLTMEYCIEDVQEGRLLANGSTVLVAYDYRLAQTRPIPADWRATITQFEETV